ncbi:hypothetical protein HYW21_00860 [Candidatus Woesearchaeota archaeon]|nr:hypothetical protein [Candidatus Woesearchaeota archaeon]
MAMHNIFAPRQELIFHYHGLVDFEALHHTIVKYFDGKAYEVHEPVYKHKIPSPAGYEIEWKLDAFRKTTDYFKDWIHIHAHAYDMKDVEVTQDGEKKVLTDCRLRISFKAELESDWQGRFTGTKFRELLGKMYLDLLFTKKLTLYGDRLEYKVQKLMTQIKEALHMTTDIDEFADRW